jgi:hypothetical protein
VAETWSLDGTVLIACNCDYGCPCNFNALPTQGYCHGQWTWHVEKGRYGDVALDDLNFTVAVKWPGAIHEGNGHGVFLVDERADEAQRAAIDVLLAGEAGGPWQILGWTWPTVDGPFYVPYELELAGVDSRVTAGDHLEIDMEAIKNPVTGAEVHPAAVLPEGLIVKQADFGSSKVFRVRNGIEYEHPGKYVAVGPFSYAGPS